jgi:hypothetical protein
LALKEAVHREKRRVIKANQRAKKREAGKWAQKFTHS